MKKIFLLLLAALLAFGIVSCNETTTNAITTQATTQVTTQTTTTEGITTISYTVTFNSNGGSNVANQTVVSNHSVIQPTAPTREGYTFDYWYLDDENTAYQFSDFVTSDIELTAKWTAVVVEPTDEEKINADIQNIVDNLFLDEYKLNFPKRGIINRSKITWESTSKYISNDGIILPLPVNETITSGEVIGTFVINDTTVTHTFQIPLAHAEEVVITNEREVPFENLTTEYDVPDGSLTLYFEDNGSVPYVNLEDFFNLLDGFIDPTVDMTITHNTNTDEFSYQYYSEDEDVTYDLNLQIDADNNTITTNDPGFYWAYVYSTETNYGRHIDYDYNNPNNYYEDGSDIVYDLDNYNLDIAEYQGEILLPYYIVNQLFAGSSYYNVYYNYDGLFGIYSLPSSGTSEYRAIKRSSMNNTDIPSDLLVHTFNMLAFDLDYFYGLKDIMGVDSYYGLLYENKDTLLQSDPEDFDYAIRDLLLQNIDEPHTSYGYPSYFNKSTWSGPETNRLEYYGSRFTQWYYAGLVAVDDVIEAKWGPDPDGGWAANNPLRPDYWFLDDVSAVLILDDFNTADIEESVSDDNTISASMLDIDDASVVLPSVDAGTKYFYYNNSTEKNNILEIIVKGLDSSYVDTYGAALTSMGYTYVLETTTDEDKANGYYEMTVGETNYMVQISFDEEYNLFYIGIIDKTPTSFEDSWPLKVNVHELVKSDSAVYVEMTMDLIMAEKPGLTNILLDLSWNTGGNVGALYRIIGFITDEPFKVSGMDRSTGGASTTYVSIVDMPDYSYLNWGLLITPTTFSAANEMATIFMENDFGPIIGVQSGGGACSITPILLPNGTAFTMSSDNINAYRTGTGTTEDPYVYHDNEFGIIPDYVIDIDKIYNVATLLQIFEPNS